MGALARLTHGLKHVDLGFGRGIVSEGIGTGVGIAASYGLGQLHGRYRDNEHVKNLPIYVGVGGKVLALASHYFFGPGVVTASASEVGQAGLNAIFLKKGIEDGSAAVGRKIYVLPPGAREPQGLPAGTETVLGDLPPPKPGRYLQRDRLASLARQL